MPHVQKQTELIDGTKVEQYRSEIIDVFGDHIGNRFIQHFHNKIKDRGTEWKNSQISFVDGGSSFKIISGNGKNSWVLYNEDGETEAVMENRKIYLDECIDVPLINKRVLGKAIIRYIGHEGLEGDERQQGLRKLLQATIDYLQTHNVPGIWDNATIKVYDMEDNKFVFTSGKGENKFVVNYVNGQPDIIYMVRNKIQKLKTTDEICEGLSKSETYTQFFSNMFSFKTRTTIQPENEHQIKEDDEEEVEEQVKQKKATNGFGSFLCRLWNPTSNEKNDKTHIKNTHQVEVDTVVEENQETEGLGGWSLPFWKRNRKKKTDNSEIMKNEPV